MNDTVIITELNSIMRDFDKFVYSFEQSVNLLSRNFIIDNEKYDNKKIDLILKNVNEFKKSLPQKGLIK